MALIMYESCCISMLMWDNLVIFLFITTGLTFSTLSSLDCSILDVQIGFYPTNSQVSQKSLGLGLWSFESFYKPGECFFYDVASKNSVVNGDDYYKDYLFGNSDSFLLYSRIVAVVGFLMAFVAFVILAVSVILFLTNTIIEPSKVVKIIVVILLILALLLEICKVFLFRVIKLCTEEVWLENENSSEYVSAESCSWSRGALSSFVSSFVYLITSILIISDQCFKKPATPAPIIHVSTEHRRDSGVVSYGGSGSIYGGSGSMLDTYQDPRENFMPGYSMKKFRRSFGSGRKPKTSNSYDMYSSFR